MKRATREEVEATNRALSTENGNRMICMSAMVDGAVKWFGSARRAHRVGLVRPAGAAGGYVIHTYKAPGQSSMVSCVLLDDFDAQTRQALAYSGDREEAYYLRSLCEQALRYRHEVMNPKPAAPAVEEVTT